MRGYVWLLLVAAGLSVGCGSSTNVAQERSALLAADRQWSQTTTDLSKFLSYYAADASVYPQGMPIVTGSEAIRDTFTKMTSMPGFSLQWNAAKAAYGLRKLPSPDRLKRLARPWRPYRSLASLYLWRSLDNEPA